MSSLLLMNIVLVLRPRDKTMGQFKLGIELFSRLSSEPLSIHPANHSNEAARHLGKRPPVCMIVDAPVIGEEVNAFFQYVGELRQKPPIITSTENFALVKQRITESELLYDGGELQAWDIFNGMANLLGKSHSKLSPSVVNSFAAAATDTFKPKGYLLGEIAAGSSEASGTVRADVSVRGSCFGNGLAGVVDFSLTEAVAAKMAPPVAHTPPGTVGVDPVKLLSMAPALASAMNTRTKRERLDIYLAHGICIAGKNHARLRLNGASSSVQATLPIRDGGGDSGSVSLSGQKHWSTLLVGNPSEAKDAALRTCFDVRTANAIFLSVEAELSRALNLPCIRKEGVSAKCGSFAAGALYLTHLTGRDGFLTVLIGMPSDAIAALVKSAQPGTSEPAYAAAAKLAAVLSAKIRAALGPVGYTNVVADELFVGNEGLQCNLITADGVDQVCARYPFHLGNHVFSVSLLAKSRACDSYFDLWPFLRAGMPSESQAQEAQATTTGDPTEKDGELPANPMSQKEADPGCSGDAAVAGSTTPDPLPSVAS